mmetsp:Transcript_5211/g.14939  ORF Transcript_5211/g.14939 Transcript_5211/m.14939 type:complete len:162 (+) Transcript_5211:306-791(+)|eukprot:CAMPEP_0206139542 /NCGR_PEP_ID=MMETSP1473-20131121/6328_1 /ASSEMBLY_ACC=CAM_ASM_001109 /TAXON_ID=1461547 /ORGANISM="Stichococcus sp, Strain RCC1054" /LENGTH=161 /DNA_ID=CAMNT_0053533369 /DNA_START=244 /DNA_END=729 /DNA_ORIENTATION=-
MMLVLEIKAEAENVESIKLPKGYVYTITVKNPAGEDTREGVTVSSREEVELSGSRGTAHFALKWARDARQQANLQVVEDIKGVTLEWSGENQGWAPLVAFDCRGLEPIAFQPQDGFIVKAASGTVFEDVDLSDDWSEYDEKASELVSVSDLQWRFIVRKDK